MRNQNELSNTVGKHNSPWILNSWLKCMDLEDTDSSMSFKSIFMWKIGMIELYRSILRVLMVNNWSVPSFLNLVCILNFFRFSTFCRRKNHCILMIIDHIYLNSSSSFLPRRKKHTSMWFLASFWPWGF